MHGFILSYSGVVFEVLCEGVFFPYSGNAPCVCASGVTSLTAYSSHNTAVQFPSTDRPYGPAQKYVSVPYATLYS